MNKLMDRSGNNISSKYQKDLEALLVVEKYGNDIDNLELLRPSMEVLGIDEFYMIESILESNLAKTMLSREASNIKLSTSLSTIDRLCELDSSDKYISTSIEELNYYASLIGLNKAFLELPTPAHIAESYGKSKELYDKSLEFVKEKAVDNANLILIGKINNEIKNIESMYPNNISRAVLKAGKIREAMSLQNASEIDNNLSVKVPDVDLKNAITQVLTVFESLDNYSSAITNMIDGVKNGNEAPVEAILEDLSLVKVQVGDFGLSTLRSDYSVSNNMVDIHHRLSRKSKKMHSPSHSDIKEANQTLASIKPGVMKEELITYCKDIIKVVESIGAEHVFNGMLGSSVYASILDLTVFTTSNVTTELNDISKLITDLGDVYLG